MNKKRLILPIYTLLSLVLFFASFLHSAYAQDDLRIQQMRVQVMPEFDDPRVLVIVQGRLNAAESTFPRPVTFLLPADAQINQMASMDVTTGQTNPLAYETLPYPADPRWTAVTYTLDNAHFFYEFYYDPLQGETDKQFTYVQATPLPIDDLLVEVQEPRTAVDFALEPAPSSSRVDNFGLTLHQFPIGAVAAGQESTITTSYTKTDPTPSVSREELTAMNSGPTTAVTANSANPHAQTTSNNTSVMIIAVIGGVVAVAVLGRFLWLRRHVATQHSVAPASVAPDSGARPLFCSQCGAALKAEARFCQDCGAVIRL